MSLSIYNSLDGVLSQDKVFFSHYLFHFLSRSLQKMVSCNILDHRSLNEKWLIYIKLGPQEFEYKWLVFSQIRDVMEKLHTIKLTV